MSLDKNAVIKELLKVVEENNRTTDRLLKEGKYQEVHDICCENNGLIEACNIIKKVVE